MLRVFEAFSGYGSQSLALERLGIPHEIVAISEIDKYAIKAYYALHDNNIPNLGDISKIDVADIPDHDLFTYSFPCQDISVAGKTKGIVKGETRSGLLYECEKIIEAKRPKYLLMENVKNLVGKKFKPQFDEWLEYLEGLGYTNYWKVLNAKDYGVPQNRERVFVVSILGDHKPYKFADKIPLDKCIADILEDKVDEKYYLSDEIQNRFKIANQNKNIIGTTKPDFRTIGQRDLVYDKNGIMGALVATDYKQPKQIAEINQLGMLDIKGNEQVRRVYGTNGISPTLNTMQGGNRQPKIIIPQATKNVKVRKYKVDVEKLKMALKKSKEKSNLTIKDIADSLGVNKTTAEHWFRSDDCFSIPDENIWYKLKELLNIDTDEFDKSITEFEIKPNEYDISNRAYHEQGISPTLTATGESGAKKIICEQRSDEGLRFFKDNICGTIRTINSGGDKRVIESPAEQTYRIRKLTPRECFRLMGLHDDDIDKIQATGISNTQQYKIAGNSIVVDVLEAIFKNLFMGE